jgi:hypothetical protein
MSDIKVKQEIYTEDDFADACKALCDLFFSAFNPTDSTYEECEKKFFQWLDINNTSGKSMSEDECYRTIGLPVLKSKYEAIKSGGARPSLKATKECNNCKKPCTKQCSVCRYRYYCSMECMRDDWNGHRLECHRLKEKQERLAQISSQDMKTDQ